MPLDTERIRFTGAQIQLIRPGLADLVAEYDYVARTGYLRQPRVDENGCPLPPQLPAAPQMAVIISALDKLYALKGRAVTMSVTTLELLAFILGVRLTERLLRLGRLPRWICHHRQRARRLIRRLENDRRRALARYLEVHGPEIYVRVHLEWQATVRALRRHLVPSDAALQRMGVRNLENACTPAGAEGAGHPPEPLPTAPPAAYHPDLSFLEVDVPGPVAENASGTGIKPPVIDATIGVDWVPAEVVPQIRPEPAVLQRLRVERDRQTGEYSTAVARAVIGVLEQAPDLFPGDRRSIAGHLARCLANTEPKKYADVAPAEEDEVVMSQCKPRRAVVLDSPTTLNFYMSWLLTAMARLAPEPEIRKRVARIIQAHNFLRVHV